jgi:pyruvate dehydrogenase E2 component (dihydrolipoamide acetyltransferase)
VTQLTEVKVPDIGDFSDVPVIEILVSPGDSVAAEDALITLESDKAPRDVPAPAAGTVREIKVSVGDTVSEGSLIMLLEAGEAASSPTAVARDEDPAPAAAVEGSRMLEVTVPDIGDFKDVPVIEVLVSPGDRVAAEDALITLESDKATMDVPAPAAGTVSELRVAVGDTVSEGSAILVIETSAGGSRSPAPAAREPETPAPSPPAAEPAAGAPRAASPAGPQVAGHRPSPTATTAAPSERRVPHATPSVRHFARELGVDLGQVRGTGRKGRILRDDVRSFVKHALSAPAPAAPAAGAGIPPIPAVDFSKFGPVEERKLSRIRKISGPFLHRAWLNVPHVTHHDEADVTELEEFRNSLKSEAEKKGLRVTALTFIMKAVAKTLAEFPNVNASLSTDGESLILKHYFHIGIAVDTPNGLVVPVFRDVDQKGIFDLAAEMADVSARARDGKLKPDEMQGGCISISSLGGIGGTAFTPIVNAPEVAILGVTRSRMQPVWNGREFQPRLMLPLDLSYDHRVIDGAEAARFVAFLSGILGDLRRLML